MMQVQAVAQLLGNESLIRRGRARSGWAGLCTTDTTAGTLRCSCGYSGSDYMCGHSHLLMLDPWHFNASVLLLRMVGGVRVHVMHQRLLYISVLRSEEDVVVQVQFLAHLLR